VFNYYLASLPDNTSTQLLYRHNLFNNTIQFYVKYKWKDSVRYKIDSDMVKLN